MHVRLLFNENFLENSLRQYLGAWFYSYRMEELESATLLSSHGREGGKNGYMPSFYCLRLA